jgi:methylated-DNA-[protein]-cysteine S-methyltransferase
VTKKPPENFRRDRLDTPIGTALMVTDQAGTLCALEWEDFAPRLVRLLRLYHGAVTLEEGAAPDAVRRPLEDYFAGDLRAPDAIACRTGGTPFQRAVWAALRTIPVGETVSYGALAARIGSPKAVRAVGTANGANPISIVVPCHRLIGIDGSPTGYGGGVQRKCWLLTHEGAGFKRAR